MNEDNKSYAVLALVVLGAFTAVRIVVRSVMWIVGF